jgi:hypothetical protein
MFCYTDCAASRMGAVKLIFATVVCGVVDAGFGFGFGFGYTV